MYIVLIVHIIASGYHMSRIFVSSSCLSFLCYLHSFRTCRSLQILLVCCSILNVHGFMCVKARVSPLWCVLTYFRWLYPDYPWCFDRVADFAALPRIHIIPKSWESVSSLVPKSSRPRVLTIISNPSINYRYVSMHETDELWSL